MSAAYDALFEATESLKPRIQKMFGGHGFFAPNGGMFAAVVGDDEAILKFENGPLRDGLMALGAHPWTYEGKHKPMTMANWLVVPAHFFDDMELFAQWAAKAYRAAPPKLPSKAKKPAGAASRKAGTVTAVRAKKTGKG